MDFFFIFCHQIACNGFLDGFYMIGNYFQSFFEKKFKVSHTIGIVPYILLSGSLSSSLYDYANWKVMPLGRAQVALNDFDIAFSLTVVILFFLTSPLSFIPQLLIYINRKLFWRSCTRPFSCIDVAKTGNSRETEEDK